MNKVDEVVKALRCLSSQTSDGDCYMDSYNMQHLDDINAKRMVCSNRFKDGIKCPYHQDEFGVCFEDGECGDWLANVADLLEQLTAENEQLKEENRMFKSGKEQIIQDYKLCIAERDELLKHQPVRCGECKHFGSVDNGRFCDIAEETDYCSYGERRVENERD